MGFLHRHSMSDLGLRFPLTRERWGDAQCSCSHPSLFCVQSELLEHSQSRVPTAQHCDDPTNNVHADGCAVQPNIIPSLASTTLP